MLAIPFILLLSCSGTINEVVVTTEAELRSALSAEPPILSINLAAGRYILGKPLDLKKGVRLRGAGPGKTILIGADDWQPATRSLPDPEMRLDGLDTEAYLIRLERNAGPFTLSNMTLEGPFLHGAIFGWSNSNLHCHELVINGFRWCGIRTFGMRRAKIEHCEFINAGGRWENGKPGVGGGITGGALFACWMSDSEVSHNRFRRTKLEPEKEFYGIKVRQAIRCRFHHNTIDTNFSMELPFENDEAVEIDHNYCTGTISIPKYAGGLVPKAGNSFHIHHNWLRDSYSIEFVRNGVEIDHNLFDFSLSADHGNLISAFGQAPAPGPLSFHHNLIRNPGRGVIWMNEVYNNMKIYNNHIRCKTTLTPRTDGLFGLNPASDFSTIEIRDNIIECEGQARPLLRCAESYRSQIENNRLVNLADVGRLVNPPANRPVGLSETLNFRCGADEEYQVDGWTGSRRRSGQ